MIFTLVNFPWPASPLLHCSALYSLLSTILQHCLFGFFDGPTDFACSNSVSERMNVATSSPTFRIAVGVTWAQLHSLGFMCSEDNWVPGNTDIMCL